VATANVLEVNERQQDEMRQFEEHVAKRPEITGRLDAVLRSLFEQHREDFVQAETNYYLQLPADFLANRKPNETIEEYVKRKLGWPSQKDQSEEAKVKRGLILRSVANLQAVVLDLTTHPDVSKKSLQGFWKDEQGRDDWLDSTSRKPFKVKMAPDAEDVARKRANRIAEQMLGMFLYKTERKLLPVLSKQPHYYAQLIRGNYLNGAVEGEVRLTFTDTRSFVVRVAVKYNRTADGNPYTQYPLTWHDVYAGSGTEPVKSMSQEEVEAMFGVTDEDRWEPTPLVRERGPRFKKARWFDVVAVRGQTALAMLLHKSNDRKSVWVQFVGKDHDDTVKFKAIGDVVYRLETGFDEVREHGKKRKAWYVLVTPNDGNAEPDRIPLTIPLSEKCSKLYGDGEGNKWKGQTKRIAFAFLVKRRYFPAAPKQTRKRVAVPA